MGRKKWKHGTNTGYKNHGCRCPECILAHQHHVEKLKIDDGTWQHGTLSGYVAHSCRCDECVQARREYRRKHSGRKERVKAEILHGTLSGYQRGCRCDPCRVAKSEYEKSIRANKKNIRHGTTTGYRDGCKCDACKRAVANYRNDVRKKKGNPEGWAHGTLDGYTIGCRCKLCKRIGSDYIKRCGRNIDALMALGLDRSKIDRILNRMIASRLRIRLRDAIKNNARAGSAVRDLGCTIDDFRSYLESQFTDGMSWENWGLGMDKWNIDHIKPLNTFNLKNRDEFLIACHYTNLRPLWQKDNFRRPRDGSDLLDKL